MKPRSAVGIHETLSLYDARPKTHIFEDYNPSKLEEAAGKILDSDRFQRIIDSDNRLVSGLGIAMVPGYAITFGVGKYEGDF